MDVLDSDARTFSVVERRAVQSRTEQTLRELRPLLPGLPPHIVLALSTARNPGDVIPETGEGGYVALPNRVNWIVAPDRDVQLLTETQLRATLFHELHHMVRDAAVSRDTLMDAVVTEGMATAFERDFAGVTVPWGTYDEAQAAAWLTELMALPESTPHAPWLYRHPDGRRWIGLKTGTYIVDRAVRASGRTAAQLVTVPTLEIVALARNH
jgi:uncharacterized protein YjaZ